MTRDEVKRLTFQLLRDDLKLSVDPVAISEDVPIQDLGINSLELVNLILLLEEEWGIALRTSEIVELDTLRQLLDLLEAKLAGRVVPTGP